jgi:hypothetical protein
MHPCSPIQMGHPARTICSECGHDEFCTIHAGAVPCNNWREKCPAALAPDTGEGTADATD